VIAASAPRASAPWASPAPFLSRPRDAPPAPFPSAQTSKLTEDQARELVAELCRNFYGWGWVSGTGGGISVKTADGKVVMAPSGVQKERMQPDDMFLLDGATGEVLKPPTPKGDSGKPPKLSECAPLFHAAYRLRAAGAVLHSHSTAAVLATMLDPTATEFRCTQLEMIKGIAGHGFFGDLVVPIIENTAREHELTERLEAAIRCYPETRAVLVRRHGVYVWGDTWIQAKTQAECYDYLFDLATRMRGMGLDAGRAPRVAHDPDAIVRRAAALDRGENGEEPAGKRARTGDADGAAAGAAGAPSRYGTRCVVLDIEGTVAPVSLVRDSLFPYARERLGTYLESSYDEAETRADLVAAAADSDGAVPAPADDNRAAVVPAAAAWFAALMDGDRKHPALKRVQGRIWRRGYAEGALRGDVCADLRPALERWTRDLGLRVYCFSSGSREAQRLLFRHSTQGDLTPFFSGFFDAGQVGPKTARASYADLALTLGFDDAPSSLLFVTDVAGEVDAAAAAGWRVALAAREGNAATPAGWRAPAGAATVTTMLDVDV